jgi:hypothetical protein
VGLAGGARSATQPDNKQGRASARIFGQQLRLENKLSEQKKKELAILDAKNKKQTEVDKLAEKFDVERIGLMKALGEATDAETKLRIQSKLAILDNNEALAKKYNAELNAKTAADLLAESANKAATALTELPKNYNEIFRVNREQLASATENIYSLLNKVMTTNKIPDTSIYMPQQMPSSATTAAAAVAPTVVNTTVNTGAVLSNNQDLERYIQDDVGNVIKLGNGIVPRGSLILLQ